MASSFAQAAALLPGVSNQQHMSDRQYYDSQASCVRHCAGNTQQSTQTAIDKGVERIVKIYVSLLAFLSS